MVIGVGVATCKIGDLVVPPEGAIIHVEPVKPTSLKDSSAFGSTAPALDPIEITNEGGGELRWRARVKNASPWVTLNPDTGTVGQTPMLQVVFNPSGLDSSVYVDTVVVEDRAGSGSLETPLSYKIHSCKTTPISLDDSASTSLTTADCGALHKPRGWFTRLFQINNGTANDSLTIDITAAYDAFVAFDTSLAATAAPFKQSDNCLGVGSDPCLYYQKLPRNGIYYVEVTSADSADTGAFTVRVLHPRKPDLPDSLDQRLATDSTTPVVPGGVVSQQSVVLTAVLSDPDLGDLLQLQAEVIQTGSNFSVPTALGAQVPNGSRAYVLQSGLSDNTSYHWRLRAVDQTGRPGDWKVFPTDPAFNVQSGHDPTLAGQNQYQSDGTTVIPIGGVANQTTVIFKAQLTDQDAGNQLTLQVEAEPVGTAFDSVPTAASAPVPTGSTATATLSGLTVGGLYHWQLRVVDNTGRHTGWTSFGGNAESATDFSVTQPATQLVWQVQPGNSVAGAAIPGSPSGSPRLAVQDQNGNTITTFQDPVTVSISTRPTGGQITLLGTTTVNAQNGVATFPNLIIDTAGTAYKLRATTGTINSLESGPFNITAAAVTQLVFTVQPSPAVAGVAIAPAVKVSAEDQFGNVNATFTGPVAMAIANNPGIPPGTLSGLTPVNAVSGVATFSNLSINKTGVGYTLRASSGSLTPDTSAAFNITHAPATHLAYAVQPTTAQAGNPITPAIQVAARDAFDNLATAFNSNVTLAITSGTGAPGAVLSGGGPLPASSGTAMFSSASIDKIGTTYTLTASATGLGTVVSNPFDITNTQICATCSTVSVSPATITASSGFSQSTITVTARDNLNNTVAGATVTLSVAPPGGATLTPNASQTTNPSGVATWTLSSTVAEVKTVTAIINGITITQQPTVTVNPGPIASLFFTQGPPASVTAGRVMVPAVVVTGRDAFGNTATSFNGAMTMALSANPTDTLSGTKVVNAVSGVATFSNIRVRKVGTGYTLLASAAGVPSVTSGSFNVTFAPASRDTITVQPRDTQVSAPLSSPTGVVVTITDSIGNVVTNATTSITVALSNNPGGATLGGVKTKSASGGVAAFTDLTVNKVGTGYTLIATASLSGNPSDFSVPFDITPGPVSAAMSTVSAAPATITASNGASASTITVTARDAGGNVIQGATVVLAAAPITGNNLIQPVGTTNASGVATGTLSSTKAETKTVSATINGVPITQTATVTVNPANAATLSFAGGQPGNTAAGAIINAGSGGVKVTAFDAFANVATGFIGNVGMVITNGTGAPGAQLGGTTTIPAAAGVATFPNLTINKSANGYTLTASATGPTAAISQAFNIGAGVATKLLLATPPSSTAQSGVAIPQQPVIQIADANDNPVSQGGTQITVTITTSPGGTPSLTNATATTNSSGAATFSGLAINGLVGGYQLTFDDGGLLTPVTSATITLSAGTVSASTTTLGAAPTTITACNTGCTTGASTASLVTVTAKDLSGNPIAGAAVVFSSTGTSNNFTAPGTTNGSGVATSTFTSTKAEAKTISVTVNGVAITQTAAVTVNPALVSAGQTTVGAAPTSITACSASCNTGGGTASLITVTAKDQFSNPVPGATVVLGSTGSNNNFTAPPTTNASGVSTSTFSSSTAEAKTISATVNGVAITQTAAVTVTASTTPSASLSTVAAAQSTITACSSGCTTGGGTASLITVTAKDASNNPIQGLTVVLSASGSGGSFTPPTTTNASGVSTSTFTSTSAEAKTISATISGVGITQTASVTVNPAAVSASHSTVAAAPGTITASNGSSASTITVTAKDLFDNLIQGATVVLAANPTAGNTLTQPAGTTNSSGVATGTLSSTKAETKTVSATINGVSITQTAAVTVNPAAVSAGTSTVTATASITASNGSSAATITVTAKDQFSNLIQGATVVLAANPTTGNTLSQPAGTTNSSGVATGTLSSTKAESKTVSATITGVAITQTASVTVNPAATTQLTFTIDPSNTPAGNNISPAVVVTALDQFGNVATGFTGEVVMTIGTDGSGGSGALTYTAPVNAVAGVATFSDLKITPAGNGYTLVASATGLTGDTSPTFNITP